MYVKVTNGQAKKYTIGQLRRDNPNISFPKNVPDTILESFGVYPLIILDEPSYDPKTQVCQAGTIEQIDGVWSQGWVVTNKPQEEAELAIRNMRDELISKTDWMALSDVTMTQEWGDYRQALRDITAQEGFPYNVIWPTEPTE